MDGIGEMGEMNWDGMNWDGMDGMSFMIDDDDEDDGYGYGYWYMI